MTLQPRIASTSVGATAAPGFDPKQTATATEPEWIGNRREIEAAPGSETWRWPSERKAQYDAFDDWHDIAMQIIHRAGKSFRLMAVYKKVFRWKEGCIWDSDEELTAEAGRCDKKTISREVAMHRKLGIIALEHGWRKVDGRMLRTRIIRLAIPVNLPPDIVIRDLRCLPNHMDTRGPFGHGVHMDTRGPNHRDTRGPITIETIERGSQPQ